MTIGTPTVILGRQANIPSGSQQTTTVDAPVGSLIIVFVGAWTATNGSVTSVTDSAGNSYSIAVQPTAGAGVVYPCAIAYCLNSQFDLPAGGWIAAVNSGVQTQTIGACIVSGSWGTGAGLDATGNTHGTATSTSLSTGTLSSSDEVIFGCATTTDNFGTITHPSGFTDLYPSASDIFDYQVVASNSSVTFNPSWTTNSNYSAVIATFKEAGGGPSFQPAWARGRNISVEGIAT